MWTEFSCHITHKGPSFPSCTDILRSSEQTTQYYLPQTLKSEQRLLTYVKRKENMSKRANTGIYNIKYIIRKALLQWREPCPIIYGHVTSSGYPPANSSSILAMSTCPFNRASCSGLTPPTWLLRTGRGWCRSKASTQAALPWLHASCRGVQPAWSD